MDAIQARDHLQMVDGILNRADRSLHWPPFVTMATGLFGATVNALHQAQAAGWNVPRDPSVHPWLLLLVLVIGFWEGARRAAARQTIVDRHAGIVFGVIACSLFLVNALTSRMGGASLDVQALFWCAGFAMALLIIGLEGSRMLLTGGFLMMAAMIAAVIMRAWFPGVLAVGYVVGMIVPGAVLASRRQ